MMTLKELEDWIEERSEIVEDKHLLDRKAALKQAYVCVDNAMFGVWPDAGRAAFAAVKYELRYDPNATLWKELPSKLHEYMLNKLWG